MARHSSLFVPLFLLAACATSGEHPSDRPGPLDKAHDIIEGAKERGGLVFEKDAYGDSATRLVYLDQGWGTPETLWYYHADQGSVLLPYDTLVHLEQADNEQPFILPENLTRFRLLAQHKTPNNPDALPVGFARHGDKVGMSCATCHTSQINYRGTAIRIDGAPAMANITGFLRAVQASVAATLAQEAKLARFAASVPEAALTPPAATARKSLRETLNWFESYDTANRSSTTEGFGRMDAIGRIVNQVIRFTSSPANSAEPNAPTSFPLLWDAPRHDYVQWTAFSPNADAGSLGRNTGEVVGVFGQIQVKHYETEEEAKKGYPSTVEHNELVAMEETLRSLKSPRWPEQILPAIDRQLAARGEQLYQANCVSCHALIDRNDPRRKVVAMVTGIDVVGTDDTSAKNLLNARAPTGVLEGAISPKGEKYGKEASALALLADLATRTVAARPDAALKAIANARLHGQTTTTKQGDYTHNSEANPGAELYSYKARPLNGIWATAPYLHNGSVPSLYELLLPVSERPTTFSVGRWEFDPKKVGRVSDGQVPFVVDTRVTGNSNRGHEYGTTLPDEDRWALVEYLKTL